MPAGAECCVFLSLADDETLLSREALLVDVAMGIVSPSSLRTPQEGRMGQRQVGEQGWKLPVECASGLVLLHCVQREYLGSRKDRPRWVLSLKHIKHCQRRVTVALSRAQL